MSSANLQKIWKMKSSPSNNSCRLCTSQKFLLTMCCGRKKNIERDYLRKIIYTTTSIQITENDTLSQRVCLDCVIMAFNFYKFRNGAINKEVQDQREAGLKSNTIDTLAHIILPETPILYKLINSWFNKKKEIQLNILKSSKNWKSSADSAFSEASTSKINCDKAVQVSCTTLEAFTQYKVEQDMFGNGKINTKSHCETPQTNTKKNVEFKPKIESISDALKKKTNNISQKCEYCGRSLKTKSIKRHHQKFRCKYKEYFKKHYVDLTYCFKYGDYPMYK